MTLAVVTGAGRGPDGPSLGSAVCAELLARGHHVHAWDLHPTRLTWTTDAGITGVGVTGPEVAGPGVAGRGVAGVGITGTVVDVGDPEAVRRAFDDLGAVPDVLVNCAAMTRHPWAFRPFEEITPEQVEQELRVSLLGTCYPNLFAGRLMTGAGRGAIVNVSSALFPHAAAFQIAYGAAKAAVASLTAGLAAEFGRHGVRVNAVAPGLVETDVFRALGPGGRRRIGRMYAGHHPIPAADVARVIGFLTSADAAPVNGQVIFVDTGFDPFPASAPPAAGSIPVPPTVSDVAPAAVPDAGVTPGAVPPTTPGFGVATASGPGAGE